MAKCYICRKGVLKGYKVSHSAVKTRRFFKPNLHKLKMLDKDGKIVKRSICSKCYKKIRNNFWKGIKNDLTPISIINQAKYKKIEKPKENATKLKVMPVLPSIHDKVGNKKNNG